MHYDPEEKIAGHLGIRFQKKTRKAWELKTGSWL
jgi:hypothetical protein